MTLSKDALIFGLAYLNGSKSKLSFGGEGAKMEITDRARAALDELIATGYAKQAEPSDSIPGREHYQGITHPINLGMIAKSEGLDPFDKNNKWPTFVKKEPDSSFEP